jgi:hypothetical protein
VDVACILCYGIDMLPVSSTRYALWLSCFAIFAVLGAGIATLGSGMIIDSDPLWHIAAGDLIRQSGIPFSDPWSFTAGDYRWLNISWAWDSIMSALVAHGGWHSALAVNAIIMALAFTLIYANCLLRSKNGIASMLTVILALLMIDPHFRPLQVTHVMVAAWMLVLGQVARGNISVRWLGLLPLLTAIWVNCHGGYIVIPLLLGAFWLQAIREKNTRLATLLFITGGLCLLAMLINPYGMQIFEAAWRPFTTSANEIINEWKPFTASPGALLGAVFMVLFITLVTGSKLPAIVPAERWLAFGLLLYGLTSVRILATFTVIAAPMLACRIAEIMPPSAAVSKQALKLRRQALELSSRRVTFLVALAACIGLCLWLPSSPAAQLYKNKISFPSLHEETAYIAKYYPNKRFLNDFNLGGYLVYETRGAVPVFVDPRTETAFPAQVIKDYIRFDQGKTGWEAILSKYHIDGLILARSNNSPLMERFDHRRGFKKLFEGPNANIYLIER